MPKSTLTGQYIPARKHLSQNFLVDPHAQKRIVTACRFEPEDVVLEIGPGTGALTRLIIPQIKKLYAIEKDARLCAELKSGIAEFPSQHVELINADFLKYDLAELPAGMKVIGNLPYHISTPIIERLIEFRHHFTDLFLTVQLEFGKRLAAVSGTKDYGSLTCFVQYFAQTRALFKISPNCFRPIPAVSSCLIHLKFREPENPVRDESLLFSLIQKAFQQRRKKITNAFSAFLKEKSISPATMADILNRLKLSVHLRPENLTIKNYIDICNLLSGKL